MNFLILSECSYELNVKNVFKNPKDKMDSQAPLTKRIIY